MSNYVQKSRTIAGISLENDITASALKTALNIEDTGATSVEVTGNGNVIDDASYDSTTRKITLTKGFTAQRQIQDFPFTATDSGWSSLDADGFYTLTMPVGGRVPVDVYKIDNNRKVKVFFIVVLFYC